jgi:hypothetical protein
VAKLPNSPSAARLAKLGPRIKLLDSGTELWRIYFRSGEHQGSWNGFRFFGPLNARFDHHLPPPHDQERGVLYGATEVATCVAEVFQGKRILDRRRRDPWLVGFRLLREVSLHDLTGTWPTAAGASMAINTGPRSRAQAWSRAIYEGYASVDGMWYCSSMHANRPAVLLYERARDALSASPFFHRALADPLLFVPLKNAAAGLGYDLA